MLRKTYSLRIDSDMLDKLYMIAEYEGRSANSQILMLIRACIEAYADKIDGLKAPADKTE